MTPVDSTGHPLEILLFLRPIEILTTGRPLEIFIVFVEEIGDSMTFETNLQNSSGRPVESRGLPNRNFTGRSLDQMIWAIISQSRQGFKLSATLFVSTKMSLCLKKQAELVNCKMLWVERRTT